MKRSLETLPREPKVNCPRLDKLRPIEEHEDCPYCFGSAEEIATFCSTTYGVTFPLFEKIEVNGDGRHPIYAELTQVADADGVDGDIRWNFEKFLLSPDGEVVARFAPQVEPEADEIVAAIEANLP